jgi:hypothetical protein
VLFPSQRPRPEYRYSIPTGIPLSFDDPASGMTYCLSQTTGFYFVCGLNPTGGVSAMPPLPMPIPLGTPPTDSALPPASGVLMFRLPQDAQVSVNGVPVGLSDGIGIQAVRPGPHQIILNVAGKETTHRVNVASHAIFTITIAGVVATEP